MTAPEEFPTAIGRPATGALREAGYTDLAQLDGVPATTLLRLHGVGPKAVSVLRDALSARGMSLG